jgi:hypothetical protein
MPKSAMSGAAIVEEWQRTRNPSHGTGGSWSSFMGAQDVVRAHFSGKDGGRGWTAGIVGIGWDGRDAADADARQHRVRLLVSIAKHQPDPAAWVRLFLPDVTTGPKEGEDASDGRWATEKRWERSGSWTAQQSLTDKMPGQGLMEGQARTFG